MKRSRRALTSLVLLFSLLLTLASSALAIDQDVNSESVSYSETGMTEYAHSMAVSYLRASSLLDGEGTYFLSQAFPIEGDTDSYNHVFFVFEDDISIGYISASFIDGEYYSSFAPLNSNILDSAYSLGLSIGVTSESKNCYLYTSNGLSEQVSGTVYETLSTSSANGLNSISLEFQQCVPLVLSQIDVPTVEPYGSTIPPREVLLQVPIVWNHSVNQQGICWCASIASIGAYKTGTAVSAQSGALTLYEWLDENYTSDIFNPTPRGNHNYHIAAFNKYGLNYSRYYLGLTFSEVLSRLEANDPTYAIIEGSAVIFDSDDICHAVVICGAGYDAEANYYYMLMDPNVHSGYVVVPVTNTSDRNFTYVSNSGTYTYWSRRYQ